jgi:hypothetical protein
MTTIALPSRTQSLKAAIVFDRDVTLIVSKGIDLNLDIVMRSEQI